jgi:hypothetical protein
MAYHTIYEREDSPEHQPENTRNKEVKRPRSSKIKIPLHDIIRCMTIPQPKAALKLKCSLSTLKRRYYELDFGRWPVNETDVNNVEEPVAIEDKMKIETILNDREIIPTRIDVITAKVLQCAFMQNIKS